MLSALILVAGLVLAVFGADWLVDGASAVARRFGISSLVIGAVVVGFGTSMPEFAVNVASALHGETDLAVSNIMGSNIFNLLLILGIGGLVLPLAIRPPTWKHDLPLYVLAAMAVGICGNEQLIDGLSISEITRSDGMLFLMFFGIFLYYTLGSARVAQVGDSGGQNNAPPKPQRMGKSITGIVVGLVGLVGGGELIVRGATGVAQEFGLGQNLIGMLIVGPGTSFPELIATIVAVVKKQTNLGVGNVIGSNIFNIFFTLGITSLIQPLPLPWLLNYAVLVNVGAALLLMIYGLGRRHQIGRTKAISFLLFYAAYVSLLILWNVRHA